MIKALRKRTRPDNLVNQVRAGGKSMARRLYLIALGAVGAILASALIGPLLFLDADGMVMKERAAISADYNARVTAIHVKPGDEVKVGTLLVSVTSSETLDRIADLTTKTATAQARETQIAARLSQITTLMPVAKERNLRSGAALKQLQTLASKQLTTANRVMEATRDSYESERELAQLTGELDVIRQEQATAAITRKDFADALNLIKKAYNNGQIVAPVAGLVGAKVPGIGSLIKVGDSAVDIYQGETYVVGYLHTGRLFSIEAGDKVIVSDGKLRSSGRVLRVEAVADALPPEFQSTFAARDRQQVVRVAMDPDREGDFPIHAKVKVSGYFTPTNVTSMLKSAVGFVTSTAMRIAGIEPEAAPDTLLARHGVIDPVSTGSIRRARDDADEDQPFPGSTSAPAAHPAKLRLIRGAVPPLSADRFSRR